MTKQTIEVEVPEGWKVKEYRMPNKGDYFWHQNRVCVASSSFIDQRLIIEKIQPRRIVLEEISKEEYHRLFNDERCSDIYNMRGSYWREVKETEEPKLSLSVDECRNVRSLIKDFENLGWFVNPARSLLLQKITKFIKENS